MSPVIHTARLDLRPLELADAPFIMELLNEPAFIRYIGDKGVRSLDDARDYIRLGPQESYTRNGFGLYATALRDGTLIGICGLVKRDGLDDPDVGFAFLSRFWGMGYAVESAGEVLRFGREALQLPRIVAIVSPDNAASIAVLEKIGLSRSRTIRLGGDHDVELFAPRGISV